MTYLIHSKVNWVQKIDPTWEDTFYPSLVKKIKKSDQYFKELFDFSVKPITSISETNDFFNLYDKEIASRKNYLFKPDEHKQSLNNKISNGKNYFHGSLINKDTGTYTGGVIFSIVEDRLSFYLRAFSKDARLKYRSLTTMDFWVEKEIYEYAKANKLKHISHGNDNYPNKGRTGLILFKLKLGGKPKISNREHDILEIEEEELKQYGAPTFVWTDSDENNFFHTANLFYKENEINESILSELIKVCEWSGIKLNLKTF